MAKPRRKQPSLRVKLASALLTIVRPDAQHGNLVHVIGHQEAKTLTPEQIIARFHFDHAVHDAWGGSLHPSNLTPRPVAEHVAKTKKDRKAIDKVRRGLKRRAGTQRKGPPMPGSKASRWKKHMDGSVSLR
jgi:hypothetical protein